MTDFKLSGWHVLGTFVVAFSIVIGVNMTLAVNAVRTFPGLEVKNSYVASQTFDVDRNAQEALEWDVSSWVEGDVLTLRIDAPTGPVTPTIEKATLGRATHVQSDREIVFVFDGIAHRATVKDLARGNWNLRLVALGDDGTVFKQRIIVEVMK